MAAAMNGMALHGGVIPYSGTFLVFSDYCRPAIRLAALMGERVIHVMTHNSIGLGEDGPTHQPVEHLAALRAIPNLGVPSLRRGRDRSSAGSSRSKPSDAPERAGADAPEPAAAAPGRSTQRNRCAAGAYEIVAGRAARRRSRSSPPARRSSIAVEAQKLLADARRLGARRVGALLRAVPGGPARSAPADHRRRAGEGRGRGGGAPGLGRHHRHRRRLRRHERLSAPARPTRTFTATSASRPRRWPRPR